MKFKTLPGTDIKVSDMCLGTMTWGQQNNEAVLRRNETFALAVVRLCRQTTFPLQIELLMLVEFNIEIVEFTHASL